MISQTIFIAALVLFLGFGLVHIGVAVADFRKKYYDWFYIHVICGSVGVILGVAGIYALVYGRGTI